MHPDSSTKFRRYKWAFMCMILVLLSACSDAPRYKSRAPDQLSIVLADY